MTITINGEVLEQAVIDQELEMLRQRYSEAMSPAEIKDQEARIIADAKENAIERILLAHEARKAFPGVAATDVDREFSALVKKYGGVTTEADIPAEEVTRLKGGIADSMRLDKFFKQICKDVPTPTDEECLAYYEQHKDEMKAPEMVNASHILRQPSRNEDSNIFQAAMMNVRQQALNGADFAKLAIQNSQCSDNGGHLGWFARGSMVEAFENVVFKLEPGQVSDVFETEFGFHIAKVHEKRPEEHLPFEKVKKEIKKVIHDQRKNDEIGRAVDRIREAASIVETADKG